MTLTNEDRTAAGRWMGSRTKKAGGGPRVEWESDGKSAEQSKLLLAWWRCAPCFSVRALRFTENYQNRTSISRTTMCRYLSRSWTVSRPRLLCAWEKVRPNRIAILLFLLPIKTKEIAQNFRTLSHR